MRAAAGSRFYSQKSGNRPQVGCKKRHVFTLAVQQLEKREEAELLKSWMIRGMIDRIPRSDGHLSHMTKETQAGLT